MASELAELLTRRRVRVPLLVASGVAGALALPSTDWWLGAWVWLVPALLCALVRPPRAALADGWLAGTVFFLVLLRWLDYTFRHYSAIPWPLTWLPVLALAAYCGLYAGLVTAATAWLGSALGRGRALGLVPWLWVAGEWVRGWLLDGFPWGLMGYSQHSVLPVIQIAELTGVYGVSFLVVSVNAAAAGMAGLGARRCLPGLVATGLALSISLGFGWSALDRLARPSGGPPPVPVAVIQPSVEQRLKWDPAQQAEILARYEQLTRQAGLQRPVVILWPETSAPIFLRGDPPLLARLAALSREVGAPLLVGSVDRAEGPGGALLNSAFFLTGRGISERYDKIHLVPFGEYVPLTRLLGFIRGWAEFVSEMAPGERRTVFAVGGAAFGTVICYEVIFPELFREFVAGGARFMTNITNDAWFGSTSGPWQHLGTLPLRAVENRVAIARAANTGISAIVEPTGRVAAILPLFERGVLAGSLPPRGAATVYTRYGDWLAYLCAGLSAASLGFALYRRWSGACSGS